MYTTIT
jgi:hypothetical protein